MRRIINCKKETLELAYGYDVEEKWKPIIYRSKVVRIPETKEIPTEEELTELSTVWAIMERDQLEIEDNSQVPSQLSSFPKAANGHSCDILILDTGKDDAEQVSSKSGIAVFGSADDAPLCLKKRDIGDVIPNGDEKCTSWEQFFRKISEPPCIPSNALIIIDRYLFQKGTGKPDLPDAFYNLEHIFDSVLPRNLAYDFHILLVIQEAVESYDTVAMYNAFDDIRQKLNRPYRVVIELASIKKNASIFDDTHDRKIISNYFIGDASHGFKVFKSSGTPKYKYQKLSYECVYDEIDPGRFRSLSALNAYSELLHNYFIVKNQVDKCLCYNNEGQLCRPNELKNRLLQ